MTFYTDDIIIIIKQTSNTIVLRQNKAILITIEIYLSKLSEYHK